jgi:hypothetical protein
VPGSRRTHPRPQAALKLCGACDGHLDGLQALLGAGADPTIRDWRFDSTPAGSGRHFGRHAVSDLLERQ